LACVCCAGTGGVPELAMPPCMGMVAGLRSAAAALNEPGRGNCTSSCLWLDVGVMLVDLGGDDSATQTALVYETKRIAGEITSIGHACHAVDGVLGQQCASQRSRCAPSSARCRAVALQQVGAGVLARRQRPHVARAGLRQLRSNRAVSIILKLTHHHVVPEPSRA
jgi:hypothetical protein